MFVRRFPGSAPAGIDRLNPWITVHSTHRRVWPLGSVAPMQIVPKGSYSRTIRVGQLLSDLRGSAGIPHGHCMSILCLERSVAGIPGSVSAGMFNTAAHRAGNADIDAAFVRMRIRSADGEYCRCYHQCRADDSGQPYCCPAFVGGQGIGGWGLACVDRRRLLVGSCTKGRSIEDQWTVTQGRIARGTSSANSSP